MALQTSQDTGNLWAALAGFTSGMTPLHPDQEGAFGRFASLAKLHLETKAGLIGNGLVVVQSAATEGNAMSVTTRLVHVERGEWMESELSFEPERSGYQSAGAALSYLRRYSMMTILGMSVRDGEDVDLTKDGPTATAKPAKGLGSPVLDPTSDDGVFVRGVTTRKGENKSGPWTRYQIEVSDGRMGSTFKNDVGDAAKAAKDAKAMVRVVMSASEKNPQYLDVVSVTPITPSDEGELTLEDIPF